MLLLRCGITITSSGHGCLGRTFQIIHKLPKYKIDVVDKALYLFVGLVLELGVRYPRRLLDFIVSQWRYYVGAVLDGAVLVDEDLLHGEVHFVVDQLLLLFLHSVLVIADDVKQDVGKLLRDDDADKLLLEVAVNQVRYYLKE